MTEIKSCSPKIAGTLTANYYAWHPWHYFFFASFPYIVTRDACRNQSRWLVGKRKEMKRNETNERTNQRHACRHYFNCRVNHIVKHISKAFLIESEPTWIERECGKHTLLLAACKKACIKSRVNTCMWTVYYSKCNASSHALYACMHEWQTCMQEPNTNLIHTMCHWMV